MNTNETRQPVEVGKFYEWAGPKDTFYMGKCTKSEGSVLKFDNGPDMLDDGRYRETSPARAVSIPVYRMSQGVTA